MNTYGDELFSDERVRRSYYYAISDLAIGGRCVSFPSLLIWRCYF